MMIGLDAIKIAGSSLGECGLLGKVRDGHELLNLLFSPQGREFCQSNSFPPLSSIRSVAKDLDTRALVDKGEVVIDEPENLVLVGRTDAVVRCSGPTCLRHIILMHGAKLTLEARRHSVVTLMAIGNGCSFEVVNDGTACVEIE